MERNMMAHGLTIKGAVKEPFTLIMEINILVIGRTIREKEKGRCIT